MGNSLYALSVLSIFVKSRNLFYLTDGFRYKHMDMVQRGILKPLLGAIEKR